MRFTVKSSKLRRTNTVLCRPKPELFRPRAELCWPKLYLVLQHFNFLNYTFILLVLYHGLKDVNEPRHKYNRISN